MPAGPRVSVVMPVYNGAPFLQPAIASIVAQTLRDFEFVIVDDGSTDATATMLTAAGARDPRVRVISHPANRGAVAARNTALAHARGELIAVMDSDDVALPTRLERQVAFLNAHPDISVLGGSVQLIDQLGVPGPVKTYPTLPGLVAWSMIFFNSLAHSTVMARRACFAEGYPDGGAEDYGLLARLSIRVRMANLPAVLLQYRTSPQALTARAWDRQEEHADRIVRELVGEITGELVPMDQVRALRGLSRDQYPSDLDLLSKTAELVVTLATARAASEVWSKVDARAIRRDAGARLLLLAALAARRSPALATSVAWRGTRLSPSSVGTFTRKAARAVLMRLAAYRAHG